MKGSLEPQVHRTNTERIWKGREKKKMSMNPCRRNARKVRFRRKIAGRVERECLDFSVKNCVVFRCNDEGFLVR